MAIKMEYKSFYLSDETREKMVAAKKKMENTLKCNSLTWESFLNILMNNFLDDIENSFQKVFDLMKEEQSDNKLKFTELREQIEKHFKEQNNNIEELIGEIVKQNNNIEILQTIQSVERQNENISLDVKSIQEFNRLMNDDYKTLISSIKELLATVGDMSKTLSVKITQKIKHQFAISIPIILHHIVGDNALHLYKKSQAEVIEKVNKTIINYKNLYNSSDEYSDKDIEKIIDKYAMETSKS